MDEPAVLYHGGVGGLWRGDVIMPNHAEHRYVDGCAECEAQRAGIAGGLGLDPETQSGWVYTTSDREYARYYASRAVKGWLYKVRLEGDIERSEEDLFPTWRGRRAVVLGVPEQNITLTMAERRRLFLRWGGSEEEFSQMIEQMTGGRKKFGVPQRGPATPTGVNRG